MSRKAPIIDGFVVGGFRSFYGQPQHIGPLAKVTVIAGHNNSGKSNILLSAAKWFDRFSRNRLDPGIDVLDRPIVPEGEELPPIVFGLALRCPQSLAFESLQDALPNKPSPMTPEFELCRQLAEADSLRELDADPDLIWFKWRTNEDRNGFIPDPQQVDALLRELGDYQDRVLSNLSSRVFQRAGSARSNLEMFLDSWQTVIRRPKVITVPPVRDIVSEGDPQPTLTDTSGRGLPQLLQTWQAPSASRHREDTKRFERMNRFAQEVLEDPSAGISVPYDRATIHLHLDGRVLPLANLGKGISQVILMAAIATSYDEHLVCIEEPEINLHPVLLRKLIRYLSAETNNQYLLSTHSAHLLDNPETSVLRVSYDASSGTTVDAALTPSHRAAISQHLGYRASDILQSNSVIWVEGPSDRIYINHWIRQADNRLLEGVHYSIMFYGGRLLAHLTGEEWTDAPEESVKDFISLIRINRNMVIVIDSDKRQEESPINETKVRVRDSFVNNGGLAWITAGREIENYVPASVLNAAMVGVHPSTEPLASDSQFADQFQSIRGSTDPAESGRVKSPDKIRIAEEAVTDGSEIWDVLDLRDRIAELAAFLQRANDLPPLHNFPGREVRATSGEG